MSWTRSCTSTSRGSCSQGEPPPLRHGQREHHRRAFAGLPGRVVGAQVGRRARPASGTASACGPGGEAQDPAAQARRPRRSRTRPASRPDRTAASTAARRGTPPPPRPVGPAPGPPRRRPGRTAPARGGNSVSGRLGQQPLAPAAGPAARTASHARGDPQRAALVHRHLHRPRLTEPGQAPPGQPGQRRRASSRGLISHSGRTRRWLTATALAESSANHGSRRATRWDRSSRRSVSVVDDVPGGPRRELVARARRPRSVPAAGPTWCRRRRHPRAAAGRAAAPRSRSSTARSQRSTRYARSSASSSTGSPAVQPPQRVHVGGLVGPRPGGGERGRDARPAAASRISPAVTARAESFSA